MRISDASLRPEANNLVIVRLLLACSVIYSHCFIITTPGIAGDNLSWLLGAPISAYGVEGFFVLSGFLVYRSLATNRSVLRFALARLVRLWPGLFAMIMLTVLAGWFLTTVSTSGYFRGHTVAFILSNLAFTGGNYTLTGLDCGGTICNVNGSLWTLPWEARCYVLLAVCGILGLAARRPMLAVVLPATLAFALLWDVPAVEAFAEHHLGHGMTYNLGQIDRLWTAFAMGIFAYEIHRNMTLSWPVLAALIGLCLLAAAFRTGVAVHLRSLTIGYGAFCVGFLTVHDGRAWSARIPDYSYGMYIYAFPTMMLAHGAFPMLGAYPLMLLNVTLTVPLAAASWHCVEKPALNWLRARQRSAFSSPPAQEIVGNVMPEPVARS